MENSKDGCGGGDGAEKHTNNNNENPNAATEQQPDTTLNLSRQSSRTPFTNLTQVDADLALARTLQEQERAYMMLRMNAGGSDDYGSSENGSFVHDGDDLLHDINGDEDGGDEDAFDVHAHEEEVEGEQGVELDQSAFSNDEAYARAIQDAEERELAGHLMSLSGITDWRDVEYSEDQDDNSQDTWEIDPDELSYEELIALGEVVGTESRGLSANLIASLPSVKYEVQANQEGSTDQCVICRLDYEDGENLTQLSCKHLYHPECINNWLNINKVCPVCSAEVSAS